MSDVWNDAADSKTGPQRSFGQLLTSADYVRVMKGEPKVPFDPTLHSENQKYVQVKIGSIYTREDGSTYDVNRDYLCPKPGSNLGKEWAKIVNPSLKALNVHPQKMDEAWACWEMVPTGRTWISSRTDKQVEGTAHSFIEFYSTEAHCRAAENQFYNRSDDGPAENLDNTMPMPEDTPVDNGADRAAMAQFLPGLWNQYKPDADAFRAAIINNPMVAAHFGKTIDELEACPEVIEIVEGAA